MVDSNRNYSWRLFPSKKSPGEFYYFNHVTGKSVWKLEDLTTKCTNKDCTHNSAQNFQHYPEPHSPPDTQMTPHTSKNCNGYYIPPVFQNYPFNPFIYHNSPHMWGPQPSLPYYFPNCQKFNPYLSQPETLNKKVYMDQIVQTDISDEVEEKKNSKSQCSQISPADLAELNPEDEIFEMEIQTEEKVLALNNKPENSKQIQHVKENKENRDLRWNLEERLKKNSIKKIGDSKSTQNTTNLGQKHVNFRLDHVKDDSSKFSSESLFYHDTKPDKPKPISIHFLSALKGTKTEKKWYIVVDAEILIDDFDFIYYFVKTDNKCRLFIPHVVHSQLQVTSKGKSRGRNATISARQSLRKIEMYTNLIDVENEYKKELNVTSSVDSILNSCLEIMKTKYHVVLITNNEQLLKKAKTISVHCYTLKDLDRDGYETVTDHEETVERMEFEIQKTNEKNIDFPKYDSNLKIVMQQYKCTLTQVLEDALGNLLQTSNKKFKYNPPWILPEAISCVKQLYKDDENISNIVQQFSSYLTKNSTKDGQIFNYAPGDLITLFGYGVALLHYLRENKNQNCLTEAEEILRRNLMELSGSGKDLAVDEKLPIEKMKDEKENSSRGCENIIRVFGRDLKKVKISSENHIDFDNVYSCSHKKTNNLLNITNVNIKSNDELYNQVDKSNSFMKKTNQQRNEVANKVSNEPKIIRNLKPIDAFEEKLNASRNVFRNNDVTAAKDKDKSLKMLMIEEKDFAKNMTKDVETLNFNHSNTKDKKESNVEEFSDGDSHQAYLFMRTFLSQLNHTFKIIHSFITETLSEWSEIQSDETRMNEARYKSVNILENLLKILDYLKSVVERESNEDTSVKSIVLRAGNIALFDRRVTRYKQVIMKCLEQGKILKKALKETIKLIYNETKSETESSIAFGPINIYE